MEQIIAFDKVAKRYNGRDVLADLSFTVNKCDVIGILGKSGIGKTTILRVVSGLEKPSSGTVRISTEKIAYVFQEPRLFPWKTAFENVTLPLKARGVRKKVRLQKAMHYLEAMELGDYADYYPSQLSGGMKQRVSLARALAAEPEVLLDEPFCSLDISCRDCLLDLMRRQLKARPVAVLYISHSPEELGRIATRVFTLAPGHEFCEVRPPQLHAA